MVSTANAQLPSAGVASKVMGSDLISTLTKSLSITPEQAAGGAGSLFGLAKTKLTADQFAKVAKVVPGMDGLLKAAPAAAPAGTDAMSSMTSMLPSSIGGLASVAGSFQKLGLSPEMVGKFLPIMSKYVQTKGGSNVANMLMGALK
jgi:hypothetical protein